MASLNLGAASLINDSWVSSLKLRIGFRSKRFRRVAERWRFRVQQMSVKEQRTQHELARSAKRSDSLRQILKQYGISVEIPEENMTSVRLDELNFEEKQETVPSSVIDDSKMNTTEELPDLPRQEKHRETVSITEDVSGQSHHNCIENHDAVPSSVIDDSKMNTTEELPDLRRQEEHPETARITEDDSGQVHHNCKEKHEAVPSSVVDDSKMNTTEELPGLCPQEKYCETVSTTEDVSGKNHHNFPHLNTGALFTASLLPVLGFCIVCIIGRLHTIISRRTSKGHQHGSKRTRWRTALSDLNDPLASDELDTSPEHRISSTYEEATDEVDEACSRVELEYKRFLLECGLSAS